MNSRDVRWLSLLMALLLLPSPLLSLSSSQAQSPFDDPTPDSLTFRGRWGDTYTATWDTSNYLVTFTSDDGTFPWDWISFVGDQGVISLAGRDDVVNTFAFSQSSSLSGVRRGDVMRVKGRDIHA